LLPKLPLPQRQLRLERRLRKLAFVPVYMHFIPTREFAPTSPQLKFSLEKVFAWEHPRPLYQKNYREPPTYSLHPIKTNNARTLRFPAAAGTELASASFCGLCYYLHRPKTLYRKLSAFIMHGFSLGQGFAYCPRFFTAAPRKGSGLVSVPMWLADLQNQLRIIG